MELRRKYKICYICQLLSGHICFTSSQEVILSFNLEFARYLELFLNTLKADLLRNAEAITKKWLSNSKP